MATKQKPIAKFRHGWITASIWEQQSPSGPFLTVTFSRSYKDKFDQWQNGYSYQAHEIESLINVAIDAKEWMRCYRQSNQRVA